MRRPQKVILGLVAVVALGGVIFNFVRPVRLDSSLECTGWGGASKWLIKDGPNGQDRSVRLGAATEQLYRRDVLDPCDAKARSNLANSWQGPLLVLGVGLLAVWAVGRFRRPAPAEQIDTDAAWPPTLPSSPPTEWPDGTTPISSSELLDDDA